MVARNLCVCGGLFLTCEIEVAWALAEHVTFNEVAQSVTWLLPVGKTDPLAFESNLTWSCICSETCRACPVHGLVQQLRFLADKFDDDNGKIPTGTPLFLTSLGGVPDKSAVVDTIRYMAARTGENLLNDNGEQRFGGRALHVSGAQCLSAIGIDLRKSKFWHGGARR